MYFPFVWPLVELLWQVSLSELELWWGGAEQEGCLFGGLLITGLYPVAAPWRGRQTHLPFHRCLVPVLEISWFGAHVLIPGGLWHPLDEPEVT